jgi:hypothetical protein
MELKINVSDADFGHELAGILESLSPEEKKEIAKEVLLKALNETTDSQRTLREKDTKVLEKLKTEISSYERDKYTTPEQMRTHYKYKELMGQMKSAKEVAVEQIVSSAIQVFRDNASEFIKNDENLKKIWEATSSQIQEDFPKYVHDAMVGHFVAQMSSMQNSIMMALQQSQNAQFGIEQIRSRLIN